MEGISSLLVQADISHLPAIRRFVQEWALAFDADPDGVYDLLLAIDEMVTNIIHHGYHGHPGTIKIDLSQEGDGLVIRLTDDAAPFDPTAVPPPDITIPLEERPIGGLGIFLAMHSMDRITHRVTEQGGNELTLVKKGILPVRGKETSDANDG